MNKLSYIRGLLAILMIAAAISGCEVDSSVEPPEKEFFISKDWKIKGVQVNGAEVTNTDLSLYRLSLNEDFTFTRIGIEGAEESGSWNLNASKTQLFLFVGQANEERYFIIDLQVRKLVLQIIQDDNKIGTLEIKYELEPLRD